MKYLSILLFSLFFICSSCQREEEANPCESVECQNGGYCNNNGSCQCPLSYYGANCENEINGFTIDSIVVKCNTLYGFNGSLVEGPGDGDPDLSLELLYESSIHHFTTIHTSIVNNEVPVSTESTFYPNWSFSSGAFSTSYKLRLYDYDAGSPAIYHLIREIEFQLTNYNAEASQMLTTADGQFVATMYFSYQ